MPDLLTASAFSSPVARRDGLQIEERTPGLATVQIGSADYSAFAERARAALGIEPRQGPQRAAQGELSFIGIGPGNWLAVREDRANTLAPELAGAFDGVASVSDQSSGYSVLRISGPRARDLLQTGLPIDFHPSVFSETSAAVSTIAHIGVIVWQLGPDVFEIAFFRSMSDSFAHWLEAQMI